MKYKLTINTLITPTIRHLKIYPNNSPLIYQAGQYVGFQLAQEIVYFSIANAPTADGCLEFYIRENAKDEALQSLLSHIKEHSSLLVTGPHGDCVYHAGMKQQVILFAGGVGISQCKAILEQAIHEKDARAFSLYWSLSARDDLFLVNELERWQKQLKNFSAQIIFTRPVPLLGKNEHQGVPQKRIIGDFPDLSDCMLYCCGPWNLTDDSLPIFQQHGLSPLYTYSDRFAFA